MRNLRSIRLASTRWSSGIAVLPRHQFEEAVVKPFESIPTFTKLPFIGTAWVYFPFIGRYDLRKQHLYFRDKRERLGDIFRESIGPMNMVVSFNPDDMQTLVRNEGLYPSRGRLFSSIKMYRESRKQWYPSAGLLGDGKDWREVRSKTQKHLLKPKAILNFIDPMQDVAMDLVIKIRHDMDNCKEVPNFLLELNKWALESVALVCLDARLGCLNLDASEDSDGMKMISAALMLMDCMNQLDSTTGNIEFWRLFPTPTWKKFTTAADTYMELAFKFINRSLDSLTNSTDEDKNFTLLQSLLMDKDLGLRRAKAMIADTLIGAIDTTAITVGFLLYHMARNPEKQELLYKDIKNLLPRKEDKITTAIFNELKYLKACIKESQRLLPASPELVRAIDHDIVLSGYRVPAGTLSLVALAEIYLDEKYFSNPLQYCPERWLLKDEKFHPFAFFPFGAGARSCIGRRLAELEIITLMTEIIRNFRIEYHYEDIGLLCRLPSKPDKPLKFRFLER